MTAIVPSLLPEWDTASVSQLQSLLPYMALVAVLEIPTWPVTIILLALDKQKQAAWYELLTTLFIFVLLVGPLVLGLGLEFAIYGLTGYALLRFIISWIWMGRVLPEGSINNSEVSFSWKVNFSVPLRMYSLVGQMSIHADTIFYY